MRDTRLTDQVAYLLARDILGINNLFIWKAPEIGLGFPWHQDKFYFRKRFNTDPTIGTWTAIDAADRDARDEDGVAVEAPPGAVIWFDSH